MHKALLAVLFLLLWRVQAYSPLLNCSEKALYLFGDSYGALGNDDAEFIQALTDLKVQRTWVKDSTTSNLLYSMELAVIKLRPFDTALFHNYVEYFSSQVQVSTFGPQAVPAGIQLGFNTSSGSDWGVSAGDTLRNIFVIWTASGAFREAVPQCRWLIGGPQEVFPLGEALAALDNYFAENNIPGGYSPPSEGLRLGPVFLLSYGDNGFELKAVLKDSSWYFEHTAGFGDCPAGCTFFDFTIYRVTKNGIAVVDSDHCDLEECFWRSSVSGGNDKSRKISSKVSGICPKNDVCGEGPSYLIDGRYRRTGEAYPVRSVHVK